MKAGEVVGNAIVTAKYKDEEAKLDVNISGEKLVKLSEPMTTVENGVTSLGALERLFIAECIFPDKPGYSLEKAKNSMAQMRMIIENRRTYSNSKGKLVAGSVFSAKGPSGPPDKGKKQFTVIDIITGNNQFKGFESYPKINKSIEKKLQRLL